MLRIACGVIGFFGTISTMPKISNNDATGVALAAWGEPLMKDYLVPF